MSRVSCVKAKLPGHFEVMKHLCSSLRSQISRRSDNNEFRVLIVLCLGNKAEQELISTSLEVKETAKAKWCWILYFLYRLALFRMKVNLRLIQVVSDFNLDVAISWQTLRTKCRFLWTTVATGRPVSRQLSRAHLDSLSLASSPSTSSPRCAIKLAR